MFFNAFYGLKIVLLSTNLLLCLTWGKKIENLMDDTI